MTAPLICQWDGDGFSPIGHAAKKRADQKFVVGARYLIEVEEERSAASHRHYFSAVREAWLNLPEDAAERFPTPDHLRRHALIRTGFRDERSIACASKAEAQRVAAFVKPMDDYAIVTVEAAMVTVYTAKSQSSRAMGKEQFQASKDAVLGWLEQTLGVRPGALASNAA